MSKQNGVSTTAAPTITGTRVPAKLVADLMATGQVTIGEVCEDYGVTPDQVAACMAATTGFEMSRAA